jgi:4-amino-4-deoxy-L-arabinose transferase-like glycosyltransferase
MQRLTRSNLPRGLILVVVAAVGIPVAAAAATGGLSIPHNDAWAHSRIASQFATGGGLHLVGWNRTSLVGQVVALGPLGRWVTVQQLAVGVAAVCALIVTFALVGRSATRRDGIIAAAIVGAVPGFGLLSTSFMTDIPALALSTSSLLVGGSALDRRSPKLLAVAALIGVFGVTIREQVVAAPLAALLVAMFVWRKTPQFKAAFALMIATVATVLVFELWRRGLPNDDPLPTHFALSNFGRTPVRFVCTLALFLSPAVFLTSRPRSWNRPARMVAVVMLVGIVAVRAHTGSTILLGNYLNRNGAYAGAMTGTPNVIPAFLLGVAQIVGLASAVLLAGSLVNDWRRMRPELIAFLVITGVGTLYQIGVGQTVFDRYTLPLLPPLLAVLLVPARRSRPAVVRCAVCMALTIVLAVPIMLNALARDTARWDAAEKVSLTDVPPMSIDAGLEWLGWHSADGVTEPRIEPVDPSVSWYSSLFADARRCIVVATSPQPSGRLIAEYDYRTFAIVGHSSIYVYVVGSC